MEVLIAASKKKKKNKSNKLKKRNKNSIEIIEKIYLSFRHY